MNDNTAKLIFDFILGSIILAAMCYGFYKLIKKTISQNKSNTIKPEPIIQPKIEETIIEEPKPANNWKECYQPIYLMTANEKAQFKKILNWTKGKGMYVFTKVRLADLIKPRGHNQKLFWKIQAKHLDFIICDENMKVKLVIELQDNSHNQPERKERDEFVKQVLESCGYKIIQVKYITNEILDKAFGINEQMAIPDFNTANS